MYSRYLVSNKNKILTICIIIFAIITRFYGLNWGNGYFFHPDENNMASALSQLSSNNFNPHFFAYGQFPLYLGFISLKILSITNSFSNSIYILRFWSATFSVITIVIAWFISRKIFSIHSLIFPLLLTFTPGLIQLAHFGTTESLLIFVFVTNIWLSLKYLRNPSLKYVLFAGVITGLGLGSKLTSIFFITPILIALLFKNFNYKVILLVFAFSFSVIIFTIISSPYNLIKFTDFISTILYETQVATGSMKVFYTNQFLNSTPYIFQFLKIFPYAQGVSIFLIGLIGLVIARGKKLYGLILFPALIYFLYNGQLYTKWFRFMSPIFIILPLLSAYTIHKINSRFPKTLVIVFSIIPGIIFFSSYFVPDIRVQASDWIVKNIPPSSKILSEAGNVVNLPVTNSQLQITNFDFYNLDQNSKLPSELIDSIINGDYILIPSRRIFKNQSNSNFPYSSRYYQALFNGSLGFTLIKEFYPRGDFILNGENAEETYSVFDRPVVRIYKKNIVLTAEQIKNILYGR